MHPVLQRNGFFVKERVGAFKAVNEYDLFDPESRQQIASTTEHIGWFAKLMRFSDYKRNTPFNIVIRDMDGHQIVRVQRGVSFFRSRVTVFDEQDRPVGQFLQKLLSIGGAFRLLNMDGQELGLLQGKWTSWEFKFLGPDGDELADVTKKFAGMLKEMFSSADNYLLTINPELNSDNPVRMLILAAVVCIDMVLKE